MCGTRKHAAGRNRAMSICVAAVVALSLASWSPVEAEVPETRIAFAGIPKGGIAFDLYTIRPDGSRVRRLHT